jgi:hypothetical protein
MVVPVELYLTRIGRVCGMRVLLVIWVEPVYIVELVHIVELQVDGVELLWRVDGVELACRMEGVELVDQMEVMRMGEPVDQVGVVFLAR